MDIVVYLALIVLGAVFLFSLFILVVLCRRKYEYNRLLVSQSLRFSKLHQENIDDIEQLGPHISRALDRNLWLEEMTTGLLQHCVIILKLCHALTERMEKVQLPNHQQQQQSDQHQQQQTKQEGPNQLLHHSSELDEFICKSTARIVPRFEALLRSMAATDVDIRVIEARVGALVSACWALVTALSLASPKCKDQLTEIVQKMEFHMASLQMALEKANELEEEQHQEMIERTQNNNTFHQSTSQQTVQNTSHSHSLSKEDQQKQQRTPNGHLQQDEGTTSKHVTLRNIDENEVTSLLTDEAPHPHTGPTAVT